ncbi:hypothetical protein NEFER03_1158 [Nematocida sp. LUAm3]|nr:hypothetical protein NEFER03_1158 [Nematocida sp. LUAm3]KAI5175767.1 hypothetical protein NEFER02_1636 [Nematocida sp. LUAm2]KAI5178263.1 hypothetical protein NEFER01_1430 [Nematocida sp. LUAm1]
MWKENRRDNSNERNRREKEEQPVEADFDEFIQSDSEEEMYVPATVPEELELANEAVYKVHAPISMEWPSLTVALSEDKQMVYLEKNGFQPAITSVQIDISTPGSGKVNRINSAVAPSQIHRIRVKGERIISVSEKHFTIRANNFFVKYNEEIQGGYALCAETDSIYYGNGSFLCKHGLETPTKVDLAHPEIFSVSGISSDVAVASSTSLSLVDFREEKIQTIFKGKIDINSTAYNKDNLLLFGDDKGALHLFDLRNSSLIESISFHKSPISHVSFGSRDVFASSSDCEVALWDTSFTEEWEYHKYLNFVHQGQKYYKDFQFLSEDTLLTTSQSGLCLFSPQTEEY